MSLLDTVKQIVEDSGHKYATVAYIFEQMSDSSIETSGLLNVALMREVRSDADLPIVCMTGYVHTKMVREDSKKSVARKLVQNRYDIAFGVNEIADSKTGYIYSYASKHPA